VPTSWTKTFVRLVGTLVLVTGALPALAEPPPAPTPVFFVPLKVSDALRGHERTLRQTLTARLLATGKFVAAVSTETERAMQECIRSVNRDQNAEQCWVRIGQGQGAEMMVSGELRGSEESCDVSVQLTVLETRVSPRMHVQMLEPCGKRELFSEMGRAARVLAGLPVAAAQPSQPTVQPTQPTVQPSQPTVQPTQPAVEPGSTSAVGAKPLRPSAPVPPPVAAWRFDRCNPSSLTVADSSGNAANGVKQGGVGCAPGRKGLAASFDGKDDRVEIADRPSFHFKRAMTAAAWIKPAHTKDLQTIVNKCFALDTFILLVERGSVKFSVSFPDPGNKWGRGEGVSIAIPANRWIHVAGVFDGARVYLYVDGVLVAQKAAPGTLQQSDRPVVIGHHPDWNAYTGLIDEVYLFDVALSEAQVRGLAGL